MFYSNKNPLAEYALERGHYSEDPPEKPSLRCAYCDDGIFPGEQYYDFDGFEVCENCLEDYLKEYQKTASIWTE